MDWFLISSDEDKSYSIVHKSFVMNAGAVEKSDTVSFFYRNKPFVGTIISSGDRDALNEELVQLGHIAKRTSKDPAAEGKQGQGSLGKRSSQPPGRYGYDDDKPPVSKKKNKTTTSRSSELNQKKKYQELKKKESRGQSNQEILSKLNANVAAARGSKRELDDADESENSNSSDSSAESDIREFSSNNAKRKEERTKIIKGIQSLSPPASPTKEALKIRLEHAELKLQMMYDDAKSQTSKDIEKELKSIDKPEEQQVPVKSLKEPISDLVAEQDSELEKARRKSSIETDRSDGGPETSPKTNEFELGHSDLNDNSFLDGDDTQTMNKPDSADPNSDTKQEKKVSDSLLDDSDDADDTGKDQLYGKMPGFVLLHNDIYCHKEVLKEALSKSTNCNHIARRLLVGVFKPESLENCTLTGQEWRAGPAGEKKSAEALCKSAVTAIIDYAKSAAVQRKWEVPKDDGTIKHSMSCRLGEIKRAIKKDGVAAFKKKYL